MFGAVQHGTGNVSIPCTPGLELNATAITNGYGAMCDLPNGVVVGGGQRNRGVVVGDGTVASSGI